MKKILSYILITIIFCAGILAQDEVVQETTSTSNDLVNKNGMDILPAAGDFAIGVDALPFLRYAGNMFNGATATNTLNLNSMNIYGRYFLSSDACIRLNLYINNQTTVTKYFVTDDAALLADPLSQAKVEDKRTRYYTYWRINAGYQKFRGYGRLKGFYGASIGYGQSRDKYEYQYGNDITQVNQSPTTVSNWNTGASTTLAQRDTESDNGLSRYVEISPLAGIEYYFAPKMCIGAEINITYSVDWSTEGDSKYEYWINGGVQSVDVEETPGGITRDLETSGLGAYGGLYLMFHF